MKHKVKYTKKEYREEYLNSDEWRRLRNTILNSNPDCSLCGKPATEVHHLVYRNFVDVKVTDLIPICRECHDYVHESIKNKWISQNIKDLEEIKRKTLELNFDEEYQKYTKWIKEKHFLSDQEKKLIKNLQGFVIQKISSLVKRHVWYDKLDTMKFSGNQILGIRKIIQTAIYRRKEKIDFPKKTILKPKKYSVKKKGAIAHLVERLICIQ